MTDVIRRYLKDAIAAENSFESQLRTFATEGDDERAMPFFSNMRTKRTGRSRG